VTLFNLGLTTLYKQCVCLANDCALEEGLTDW